jgi:hypothetical protein
MQRPEWVTNEPQWIKQCCQIRARAEDLVAERIGVIEAARALLPLIFWTRRQDDPDLAVFTHIDDESAVLPVGPERSQWAAHALEREDAKIRAIEEKWREAALRAGRCLVEKYAWSLEARAALRRQGARDAADQESSRSERKTREPQP